MSAGKPLLCFVVMPQSNAQLVRDEKQKLVAVTHRTGDIPGKTLDFEKVYEQIVCGALEKWREKHGARPIEAQRGIDIGRSGTILHQVLKTICEADITITDVSTHNPNCLLELGVRLAVRPSMNNILICWKEIELPFDLLHERCVFYTDEFTDVVKAREKLVEMLEDGLPDSQSDSSSPRGLNSTYELIAVYANRRQEREPVLPLWETPSLLAEVLGSPGGPNDKLRERIVETLITIGAALRTRRDRQKDAIIHYRMLEQSANLDRDSLIEVYSALSEIYSDNGMKKEAAAYIQKMKEIQLSEEN